MDILPTALFSLHIAQVVSVDVFYDEDEGTKVVVWNNPEGEVTIYSIRISYSENGVLLTNNSVHQKIHGFNCVWQIFLPRDLSGLRYLDF